jgi:hypothetical protein
VNQFGRVTSILPFIDEEIQPGLAPIVLKRMADIRKTMVPRSLFTDPTDRRGKLQKSTGNKCLRDFGFYRGACRWKNGVKKRNALHSANRIQRNPLSYKEPKLSIGWQQKHVHTQAAEFISRQSTGGQLITGQHAICFHNSRILSNAVPLGFCFGGFSSTAGYAPATKLNFR